MNFGTALVCKIGMKTIYLLAMLLVAVSVGAQDSVVHRYASGERACVEWNSASDGYGRRDGQVRVYSRSGTLVYTGYRRNYAGHASVRLSFHPSGGVSRIEASSVPDAGIQWYRETLALDEVGSVVYRDRSSHEDLERITLSEPNFVPTEKRESPERTVGCAVPHGGQTVIYQLGRKPVRMRILRTDRPQPETVIEAKLHRGDSLPGPLMIRSDHHPLALESLVIEIQKSKRSAWEPLAPSEFAIRSRSTAHGLRHEAYWLGSE